jgi:hypothetical protein
MPESFDEFTPREVASVLGETSAVAGDTLSLAIELEVSLPGTKAAFRSGLLNQRKAAVIAAATALLDPAEARAAEAKVLDRAGALAPPALRAAIQRAVMQVAPQGRPGRRYGRAAGPRVPGHPARPGLPAPRPRRGRPPRTPGPYAGSGGAGGPLAGVMIPPGFAGHVTLTVPEASVTGRADRPGELAGIGPVDPDPGANTPNR